MKLKLLLDNNNVECLMDYGDGYQSMAKTDQDTFNKNLSESFHYSSTILMPPAIRYLSADHKIILFERPPTFVTYQMTDQMQEEIPADAKSKRVFRIPIPWQRYIVLLSADNMIANLFMFFAKREIENLYSDPLCLAPICNFYANGRLCLASYQNQPEYEHSIPGVVDRVLDMVWNSGFNFDTVLALNTCIKHIKRFMPFSHDFNALYQFWSKMPMSEALDLPYPAVYNSFNHLLETGHLYHEYTGDAHDVLLKIALAVQ